MRLTVRLFRLLLPLLLCSGGVAMAGQGASNPDGVIAFDIPALPLEEALVAFGRAANVQIAYDANLLHDQRSSPVIGRFRARDALELMLRGTGLRVRYTNRTGVTLAPIQPLEAQKVLQMEAMRVQGAPLAADGREFVTFARALEARIVGALQRDAPGFAFDLTVRLWLGQDGSVERAQVVSSTLPEKRTRAVIDIMRKLPGVGPVPAGMPQPLPFRFSSRAGF